MAVNEYSTTDRMVLDEVGGLDVRDISATSSKITWAMLTRWRQHAAGMLEGIWESNGGGTVDDQATQWFQVGIVAYAKARVYERMNRLEDAALARADFDDVRRWVADRSQAVAGDLFDGSEGIKSNVDTSDPVERTYATYNDTRLDGWKGW